MTTEIIIIAAALIIIAIIGIVNRKRRQNIKLLKITDKKIFNKLGKQASVRNGIELRYISDHYEGYISDDYLYDNCLLEIGFGRIRSDRGDWGGGAEYASDSPLKITIDKDFTVRKVNTASFGNKNSQKIENTAKKIAKKIQVGTKLSLTDIKFENDIKKILEILPYKNSINWDVFNRPHMVNIYLNPENKECYPMLRTPAIMKKVEAEGFFQTKPFINQILYKKMKKEQFQKRIEEIKKKADGVEKTDENGRYKSLVATNLEAADMWLNDELPQTVNRAQYLDNAERFLDTAELWLGKLLK